MSIAEEIYKSDKFIVFELPEKKIDPVYIMGVDQYEENRNDYCLMKDFNGKKEIILQKTIRDEDEFNKEVENLMKYFNIEKLF